MTDENQQSSSPEKNIFKTIVDKAKLIDYFQSMIIDDEVYVITTAIKTTNTKTPKLFIEQRASMPGILGVCRVFWNQFDANDYLTILEQHGLSNKITSKITPLKVADLIKLLSNTDDISYKDTGTGIRAESYTMIGDALEFVDTFWTREISHQH